MELDMVFDEGVDEVVAVVVSFLPTESEVEVVLGGRVPEEIGLQVFFEVVCGSHVDQSGRANVLGAHARGGSLADEIGAGVLLGSFFPVGALQVETEGLC